MLRIKYYPHDGSAPLYGVAKEQSAPSGVWRIQVEDPSAEKGTPHRIFETFAPLRGPLDVDRKGTFTVVEEDMGEKKQAGGGPEAQALSSDWREMMNRERLLCACGNWPSISPNPNCPLHGVDLQRRERAAGLKEAKGDLCAGASAYDKQARAPGKTFTRAEVLAVLRAQRALNPTVPVDVSDLIQIFENME